MEQRKNQRGMPAIARPGFLVMLSKSIFPRLFLLFLLGAFSQGPLSASEEPFGGEPSTLVVLWTSGDPEVAHRMALMYTHGAKKAGWFDEVRLIIWGPSQRLLAADKDIQAKVAAMREDGILVEACIVCAKSYGLVSVLEELGLAVRPMGAPLSEFLKSAEHKVLTF